MTQINKPTSIPTEFPVKSGRPQLQNDDIEPKPLQLNPAVDWQTANLNPDAGFCRYKI